MISHPPAREGASSALLSPVTKPHILQLIHSTCLFGIPKGLVGYPRVALAGEEEIHKSELE